jgi:glycosyltransferase involved in cell wall biosynthesis
MNSYPQRPLRVLQLVPALNEGGVERGTVELSRELVQRGMESVVISKGGKLVPELERTGTRHIALDISSKNPLTVPLRVFRLWRLLREIQPSIVHARSRVPAWLCVMANRHPRYPFVTTVHGLNSVSAYSRVMTLGDHVICVGEVVSAYICKHYGINQSRITVIQRGVDMASFNPTNLDHAFIRDFRHSYGLNGRRVVLSVGRITWLKDYEGFIDAISLVRRSHIDVVGVIVGGIAPGKEAYADSLLERVAIRGLEGHVVFTGSHSKMAEIYDLSDVVVNNSLKMGNVARTVSEALAMGTPVVATTEKGLDNLVVDGLNGYIVESRDPLDLAKKIKLAMEMPPFNIRQTLQYEFTLNCMVDKTMQVYQACVGHSPPFG